MAVGCQIMSFLKTDANLVLFDQLKANFIQLMENILQLV